MPSQEPVYWTLFSTGMDSEDLFIRFDECLSKIQGVVDGCKGTIEAVNILMVVVSLMKCADS